MHSFLRFMTLLFVRAMKLKMTTKLTYIFKFMLFFACYWFQFWISFLFATELNNIFQFLSASVLIRCDGKFNIQQTINVGILNKFFVQYHLTIGQTPYVKWGTEKTKESTNETATRKTNIVKKKFFLMQSWYLMQLRNFNEWKLDFHIDFLCSLLFSSL